MEIKRLGEAKLGHVPAETPYEEIYAETVTNEGGENKTLLQGNKPVNTEHPNEYMEFNEGQLWF